MVSTSNVSGGDAGIMGNMGSANNFSGGNDPRTAVTPRKRIAVNQISSIMRQAQTFQLQGRFDDAIQLCQQILESGFDRPEVRFFLGWLYHEQRHWDEAIYQFQKLLNDPDFALSCHYQLGQCYRERGDLRAATTHFDEAVERVNLDDLTIDEADQLLALCQETVEVHYQLGEQKQARSLIHALLGFLRSRGWSEQVAQVEFMLEQLQNNLPPRLGALPTPTDTPTPVPPQPQPEFLQHMRQWATRSRSTISLLLQRRLASHPFRSNWLWRTVIVLLLIGISLGSIGTSIWLYVVHQNSRATSSTAALASKTAPHPSPTMVRTLSPTPSSTGSTTIAGSYHGTLHDIATGMTANISLTMVQQQQGNISGNLGGLPANGASSGMPQNGPFTGTINASQHIQFIVTSSTGQTTFSFIGLLRSDGVIAGTYCNLGGTTGKCSDYGIWSLSP